MFKKLRKYSEDRTKVYRVLLHEINGERQKKILVFTTHNPRFGDPSIDVTTYIENNEYGSVKVEEEFNLCGSRLGYYSELAKEYLNISSSIDGRDSEEYKKHIETMDKISNLFIIMGSLTGYTWYY